MAAIGTAAVAAGKALYDMASDTASAGDQIDKESQKMQISASLYQQLSYACERSGSSVSDLTKGVKNITTELGKTAEGAKGAGASFKAIGVSLKNTDGSIKSTEQVLLESIDALAGMEDETQRNAAAQDIFGKSAAELLPLLNSGADGIKQLMDETEEYGMIMSDEAVAASAAFEDSLSRLQWTFSGVKNSITGEMLPSITMIMDGLSDLMAGQDDAGEKIKQGVTGIISNISQMIPQILEVITNIAGAVLESAPSIMQALAQGIITALPTLLPTITNVVTSIATMLIQLLPQILEAGMQILISLAQASHRRCLHCCRQS